MKDNLPVIHCDIFSRNRNFFMVWDEDVKRASDIAVYMTISEACGHLLHKGHRRFWLHLGVPVRDSGSQWHEYYLLVEVLTEHAR